MAGNFKFQFNDDVGDETTESELSNPFNLDDDEEEQERMICVKASQLFDKQE